MSIIGSYIISDLSLQVECEDNLLGRRIIDAIDGYFYMTKLDSPNSSPNITLRFKNNNSTIKFTEFAQELFISSLQVLKDGNFHYLVNGDSIIQLNVKNCTGIGSLDSDFWNSSLKSKHDFLMLSILWLIRPHGLYALHANSAAKDEVGVLVVGDTGSGKSTTALSLIRQGWGYLSDDVTLIRHTPDGIEAIAFLKGFSFDQNLVKHFPELNKSSGISSLNGQKRFLDIKPIYPVRFQASCFPKVLIFPKIVSSDKSKLIPIDRTKALVLLAENSGGIMVDREMVVKQMEVLKGLAYQTSSYQLLAGRDLYEEPERITEVLNFWPPRH